MPAALARATTEYRSEIRPDPERNTTTNTKPTANIAIPKSSRRSDFTHTNQALRPSGFPSSLAAPHTNRLYDQALMWWDTAPRGRNHR